MPEEAVNLDLEEVANLEEVENKYCIIEKKHWTLAKCIILY
jgi:hypothetical protein